MENKVIMVTVLKSGASKSSIQSILKKLGTRRSKKGFEAQKFCGILKIDEDALAIQKRLRDEWK